MTTEPRYSVGTWDTESQCFTPQIGVPSINLTLWELRASLRELRNCGYTAHRRRVRILSSGDEDFHHDDNDAWTRVDRTDGMSEAEILEAWKR